MQKHSFHPKRIDAEEWQLIPHLMLLSGKVLRGWKQTWTVTSHYNWAEVAALAKERGCLALEASRTSSLFEQTHLRPHWTCFLLLMGYFFTANLMSYINSHQASRAPEPAEGGQRGPWFRKAVDPQLPFQGQCLIKTAGWLPAPEEVTAW